MPELIYTLALLACPVGMGLMMFFMMRSNRQDAPGGTASGDELARLRAELDQLRAAQRDVRTRPSDAEPWER